MLDAAKPKGPGLAGLDITRRDPRSEGAGVDGDRALERSAAHGLDGEGLLEAVFGLDVLGSPIVAAGGDKTYTVTITGTSKGALFAVEVVAPNAAWRYPDPFVTQPYIALPA